MRYPAPDRPKMVKALKLVAAKVKKRRILDSFLPAMKNSTLFVIAFFRKIRPMLKVMSK
ncbi:hypothetical protein ES705_45653 [subsurface metagenome]